MASRTTTLSGNSGYYLETYTSLSSQSVSGNWSKIYYRIRVYKKAGADWAWSTTNMGNSGWADSNIGGNPDLWNGGNLAYDFRDVSYITFKEGYFTVYHDSQGNGSYYVNAYITLINLGSARADSGTITLPDLADPPPAPTPLGLDQRSQTSMRYRFSSNGDGGAPILEWRIGYGTSPTHVQKYLSSSGTSTVTGLLPGTIYYFWSQGRNKVGWGPLSSRMHARTIAGARVRVNGVWKEAVPYVKVNGVWKLAQPYVKKNDIWVPTE